MRTARVRKADGTYGYAYVGGIFGTEDREDLRTGPAAASSSGGGSGAAHNHSSGAVSYSGIHTHVGTGTTGDEASHKHGIDSEDRATVVGKCLTACRSANQVIDVLVDIAG